MQILGVRIDNFNKNEILETIELFFSDQKFHQVATVNPEFILRAQKDDQFKNILNGCDMNVADGIGLKYAFWRHGKHLKTRFAGADLMHEILRIADERNTRLFLAIHPGGLSSFDEIRSALKAKYPNIRIGGGEIDPKKDKKWPVIAGYQLVFCNFGFPRQEKFINSVKNDTIRLAMGVGGAFDFVTGKIRRAPKAMRFVGLEWLFRLCIEPTYRIKRIFNAVMVFPIKVICNR